MVLGYSTLLRTSICWHPHWIVFILYKGLWPAKRSTPAAADITEVIKVIGTLS